MITPAFPSETMMMRISFRPRHFLCLLLPCLIALPAFALEPAQITDVLETLRTEAKAPGASVAIMVKGELVYSGGVGLADVENEVPLTGRSVHNIGSISKLHGVIAIMQLVEQGKLDLDAEIQTWIPWFPRKQAAITLRHILTHTSGIRHYQDGEFGEGDVLRFRQFDDIETASARWRDDPLLFTPGSHWYYSSYATNLLQAVIEQVSGQSLEAYLKEHVWTPAGLTDTHLDIPARIIPRRTRGYQFNIETGMLTNAIQENVSYKYVGGGILGSDEDSVRFAHALNSGRLLEPASITEMYRPQLAPDILPAPDADENAQVPALGLIWWLETAADGREYQGHGGSVKGTLSYLLNDSARDVVVAVHVNAWGGQAELKQIAETLASLAAPVQ